MGTARYIKRLEGFTGDAALYELNPPLETFNGKNAYTFVAVSATIVQFGMGGPETYIFGADEDGEILDLSELPGSFRGGLDHAAALESAGYEIVE